MGGRKIFLFASIVSLVLAAGSGHSRRSQEANPAQKYHLEIGNKESDLPVSAYGSLAPSFAAQMDTFVLARFSFDEGGWPSAQGWHAVDRTIDTDTFFHVADANELNDPSGQGLLVPLEGNQSLWCGAAPSADPYLCSYVTLPGYGVSWNQEFSSVPFARTGDVTISYLISWDSEPWYDRTVVHYTDKNGGWADLKAGPGTKEFYDSRGSLFETYTIPDSALGDSIRVRFYFSSDGAWCDEDGLWDTDGAVVLDSLRLTDAIGELDFQDFEDELPGDKHSADGRWRASTSPGYGDYSGLHFGDRLLQEDPCRTRFSGMWAFISGSTYDYACGGFPEQPVVPWEKEVEVGLYTVSKYIANEVWSPYIEWTSDIENNPVPASASSALLEFDVYRDLPIDNLVFYYFNVRGVTGGCPGDWPYGLYLGYGRSKDWFRHRAEVAGRITGGATQVQIALGAWDMCYGWCGPYGYPGCHSHAPLFDNVRLVRIDLKGPAWAVRPEHMFQDNFAADSTVTGTVPIDMAGRQIYTGGRADSAVVQVVAPNVGIDDHVPADPNSGPAVYCHVKNVSFLKSGAVISGDLVRWPVASSGTVWTVLRCDYALDPFSGQPVRDMYCIDLNDNLFVPGDTVWYYFSARDKNGNTNFYSVLAGVSGAEINVRTFPNEVTCLPANALVGATDILYVDDFDNRGAQPFFDSAFERLGIMPDRYDVLAPSGNHGNGPGSRVLSVTNQILGYYKKIIWNSGDLEQGLIGDGSGSPADSDDFGMLYTFLYNSPVLAGLYISGDNIAEEWVNLTGASAVDLRNVFMNVNLTDGDHVHATGATSPLAIGLPGGCFYHPGTGADEMVAFGGDCGAISNFDVIQPYGAAALEMAYSGDPAKGAVLSQVTVNAEGGTARVLLSGFSYHSIRDDEPASPEDRLEHLVDILRWMDDEISTPSGAVGRSPFRFFLYQNYPNPFNPNTTIRFTLAKRSGVSLKIYNAAGQLVKILLNEQRPPGTTHTVTWDGRNNRGQPAATGVYFYKLQADGASRTKKMILLK